MQTIKLPSGVAVQYRGMRGKEEEILTNRKKLQSGEAWDEVIASCVSSMGVLDEDGTYSVAKEVVQVGDILRLRTPDRDTLTWAIRIESYGEEMQADVECTLCNHNFGVNVDLTHLPIRPIPEGYDPDTGFTVQFHDGEQTRKVEFNYMNGSRERQLARMESGDGLITMAMLGRLGEVEGISYGDRKAWLLNLPIRARRELRSIMAAKDAGTDYNRHAECPNCLNTVEFNVQGQRNFLFPPAAA